MIDIGMQIADEYYSTNELSKERLARLINASHESSRAGGEQRGKAGCVDESDAWESLRLLWFFLPEYEPRNPHSKKATDIEHNKQWHKACELYQKYAGQIPHQPDNKQEG